MDGITENDVRRFVKEFAVSTVTKLKPWQVTDIKKAYPFHALFFPDAALQAFKQERSIVTAMGQGFYPRLACLIAAGGHQDVHLNCPVRGPLNDAACNRIEEIITDLRTGNRRPNHEEELKDILAHTGGGLRRPETVADLYVGDFPGGPLFAEIKTPRPNLDIAAESKKKMLYFLAIKAREGIVGAKAYLAFPYNPFLTRELYKHSFTKRIMDMEREVLMGEEFWDYIGGQGCFRQLLAVIDSVREEIGSR